MKNKKIILLLILGVFNNSIFACGPYFPETYLSRDDYWDTERKPFEYSYHWHQEVAYVAIEKFGDYSKWKVYNDTNIKTEEAKKLDIKEKISPENKFDRSVTEFELYEAGVVEMQKNNDPSKIPESWLKLLSLPWTQRRYRTIWTCYMIGNLHAASGKYKLASKFYKLVRESYRKGFKDTLGLAHATYKREFLSASKPEDKLNAALKAFAYYLIAGDMKRLRFIVEETENYLSILQKSGVSFKPLMKDPYLKELIISFTLGNYGVWNSTDQNGILNKNIKKLIENEDSETVSRFAWFSYRTGDITLAKKLAPSANQGGLLTLWLRAKLALHDGKDAEAARYLRKWLKLCSKNRDKLEAGRLAPGFEELKKAEKDVYGNLGTAIIHTKDFTEALNCFMRAEDWPSAAIVADTLIPLEDLIKYVDKNIPDYNYENLTNDEKKDLNTAYRIIWYNNTYYENTENDYKETQAIKNRLRYLLARRLIRNKRYHKAITYIPVKLFKPLQNLEFYSRQSKNKKLSNNERALAAYNVARILRWYGMSLSGTELWPDYQYLNGSFQYFSISPEWAKKCNLDEIAKIAEKNAPKPNKRFHYRFQACEIMKKCLKLSEDDNLKLLANLAIGYWLYKKYPKEADPYYKAAVGFRPRPISEAMDTLRWFPDRDYLKKKLHNQIFSTKPVKDLKELDEITNEKIENNIDKDRDSKGEFHGKVITLWPNGKLAEKSYWNHGVPIRGKFYDDKGRLTSEIKDGTGWRHCPGFSEEYINGEYVRGCH